MGVNKQATRFLLSLPFLLPILNASPTLRLSSAAVGPVSFAVGANGPTQTVEAANIGDGTLSLSATASDAWLAPTIGAARPCTTAGFSGSCFPVQIGFQAGSLAKGIYTGIVTVSDPNSIDAPQDITVTVQVGGGVPDSIDLYAQPGGPAAVTTFSTNSPLNAATKTANGETWLSFSLTGVGSFRFSYPYRVAVTPQPDMGPGDYPATIVTSGSSLAADNKTIGVTMHVTTLPIAQSAPATLTVRLAQGAPPQSYHFTLSNAGQGALAIAAATANGGGWLSAANSDPVVTATIDPGQVSSPGTYQGSIAVATNAANTTLTIPVELFIVAQGAPVATFQGVSDIATSDPTQRLAPGTLANLNGEQLTLQGSQMGSAPYATNLGGATVLVGGLAAPLVSVAYGQISFQVPYETPPGFTTVQVMRDGQTGNSVGVNVAAMAPQLLPLAGLYGNIVNTDGSFATPVTLGANNHPAHPGDTVIIYGIGFGQTTPNAVTGAPAPGDVPDEVPAVPNVTFGGAFTGTPVITQAADASLTAGMVGLYQVTVVVPDDVSIGPSVAVTVDEQGASTNTVRMAIDPAQ